MAVPKRKSSHARKNTRRSNVWKLDAPALMKCPQCGEFKTPHRVCGKLRLLQGQGSNQKGSVSCFLIFEKTEGEKSFSIFLSEKIEKP